MRKQTSNTLLSLLFVKGSSLLTVVFFLALGISTGAFTASLMDDSSKTMLIEYMNGYLNTTAFEPSDFKSIFISSFSNNLFLLAIIMISGITAIGFPIALGTLTYKGMAIGFSSALVISEFSIKGFFLTLLSLVPQNLFILVGLLAATISSVNLAFSTLSSENGGIKKNLSKCLGPYMVLNFILLIIILIGVLIEAFISPIMIQLVLK